MKKLIIILLFISAYSSAQTYSTIASGNYFDPNIWENSVVPPNPIPPNHMINILHTPVVVPSNYVLENNGTINSINKHFVVEGIYQGSGSFKGIFDKIGIYNVGPDGTPSPIVGTPYQGGVVAYVFQPGEPGYVAGEIHGFIASESDITGSDAQAGNYGYQWYNGTYTSTGATTSATGINHACNNTNLIVSNQGSGVYAAKKCFDFVADGYTDWCLPTRQEVVIMFVNAALIGNFVAGEDYWSSSESYSLESYLVTFTYGASQDYDKAYPARIRPIRYF